MFSLQVLPQVLPAAGFQTVFEIIIKKLPIAHLYVCLPLIAFPPLHCPSPLIQQAQCATHYHFRE